MYLLPLTGLQYYTMQATVILDKLVKSCKLQNVVATFKTA